MRVLVVEDYEPLRRSLVQGLTEAGCAVDATADGDEGLAYADSDVYDVIILDVMLPGTDGFEILRYLRRKQSASRVLMLTAKDTVRDRVHGLDLGADDYLVKPFAFDELVARVRALGRRRYEQASPVIEVADLRIDTTAKVVKRGDQIIELTAREFSILETLAYRANQVVSREDIWDRIYDFGLTRNSNVVDVYIGYLRRKLECYGGSRLIHTRRGMGYVLAAGDGDAR